MREAQILADIRLELSRLRLTDGRRACLSWRQHVGLLYGPDGTPINVGVEGMSDIGAIVAGGMALQIEVKSPGHKTSRKRAEAQARWREVVNLFGARGIQVYSVEEAVAAVLEMAH